MALISDYPDENLADWAESGLLSYLNDIYTFIMMFGPHLGYSHFHPSFQSASVIRHELYGALEPTQPHRHLVE
jgi:hypothetical protein